MDNINTRIENPVISESVEKKNEPNTKRPKVTPPINKLLPIGRFPTTSDIENRIIKITRRTFQSTFLKRKNKRIIVNWKLNIPTKKFSIKTKRNIPTIIANIFKNIPIQLQFNDRFLQKQ